MTTIILIQPVDIKTDAGLKATVTGIGLFGVDTFHGFMEMADGSLAHARWRANGKVRDGHANRNLDSNASSFAELVEAAEHIRAPR